MIKVTLEFPDRDKEPLIRRQVTLAAIPQKGDLIVWDEENGPMNFIVDYIVHRINKEGGGEISVYLRETQMPNSYQGKCIQKEIPISFGKMHCIGSIDKGCSAFRVQLEEGAIHDLHFHPKHDEIVYVIAGRLEQTIGEKMVDLKQGESAIIPKNVMHKARSGAPRTEVVVILAGEGHDYARVDLNPS